MDKREFEPKFLEPVCRNIQQLLKVRKFEAAEKIMPSIEGKLFIERKNLLINLFNSNNSTNSISDVILYWKNAGPTAFKYRWEITRDSIINHQNDQPNAIILLFQLISWAAIEHYSTTHATTLPSPILEMVAMELGMPPQIPDNEVYRHIETQTVFFPALILDKHKDTIGRDLKSVEEKNKEIHQAISDWTEFINNENRRTEEAQIRVDEYISVLDKFKTQLAFLGLSGAFKNFHKRKQFSKWLQFVLLIALAVVILAGPFISHYVAEEISKNESGGFDFIKAALVYFPFVAFEIIAIYLFRVTLLHYNSTQAQLIQLEMKMAACGFIEEYAKFSRENKEVDLSKFEALVFGGIVAELDKIPSTFDGIDVLLGMLKEIKGK